MNNRAQSRYHVVKMYDIYNEMLYFFILDGSRGIESRSNITP